VGTSSIAGAVFYGNKMKLAFEDLQIILDLHQKYLSGDSGGQKADLAGADLYGVNLAETNLQGAILTGAELKRANLWRVNLEGAELSCTNLKRAVMEGANLHYAVLKNASLKGVNLEHADLRGASLDNTDLEDVIFTGTIYDRKTTWPEKFDPVAAGAILVDVKSNITL